MLATGAFGAWAVQWYTAEILTMVKHEALQPLEPQEIVVVMPTTTPRIATPIVGTPECKIGMICETPKKKPDSCETVKAGGQPCTNTGYTGDVEDETEGSPEILPLPMQH